MKPPIITLSPVCTKLRVLMLPRIELLSGLRSYTSTRATSDHVVYAASDSRVITCWKICYDRRLPSVTWSVAAVPDVAPLIACDNPANYGVSQLSFDAIKAPVLLCSSNVGFASAFGMPSQ